MAVRYGSLYLGFRGLGFNKCRVRGRVMVGGLGIGVQGF
jgi:hypothetical protein